MSQDSPLISVVIPVYNVESYLEECLNSVVEQTYSNLQIILVDDGSTDSSGSICDRYASQDSRITVVHQKNQGAGAAKNTGLEEVAGEYLSIIDSDDYLDQNYYKIMLAAITETNADTVQCLFINQFRDKGFNCDYNFPASHNRLLTTQEYLFEMLYDWKYAVFWNKLFKTELLYNARFPSGRKIDDEFFTYKLICNSKIIVNINNTLYNYRMRGTSVMTSSANSDEGNDKLLIDRTDSFLERYQYVSKKFKRLEPYFYMHLSNYIAESLKKAILDETKDYFREYKKQYPQRELSLYHKFIIRKREKNFKPGIVIDKENIKYFK